MKCLRLLLKEYLIKGILANDFVTNSLSLTDKKEHQPKSNKKYITFYIVFQVLKVLLIKVCKIQPPYLLVLDASSADIIFHKFLTLHSTLTRKRFSSQIFLFNGFTHLPPPLLHHPLNRQNPLRPLLVESLVIVQRAHL